MAPTDSNRDTEDEISSFDGRFRLAVARDRLTVIMDRIVPHSGRGRPIAKSQIMAKLKKLKVIYGVRHDVIDSVMDALSNGEQPPDSVEIAKGDEPRHGVDAELEWFIDEDEITSGAILVTPDTPLISITPATSGETGKDVFGKAVWARSGYQNAPEAGNGIKKEKGDNNTIRYTADELGLLELRGENLAINPALSISGDAMQATFSLPDKYKPGNGADISRNMLDGLLERSRISHGVMQDSLDTLLDDINAGKPINTCIAKGQAPVDGRGTETDWSIPMREGSSPKPVRPGTLIATQKSSSPMTPGMNIHGQSIDGEKPDEETLKAGEGIDMEQEGETTRYRSQRLGMLEFIDGAIHVSDTVEISDDDMQASILLFATDILDNKVTTDDVIQTLNSSGVIHGYDVPDIEARLNDLSTREDTRRTGVRMMVAEGSRPVDGSDEQLELNHKLQAGKEDEKGNIDFHERSYTWDVSEGSAIGRILPVTPAEDGISVRGQKIPGVSPQTLPIELEGIERRTGGELFAKIQGTLIVSGNLLTVADVLAIEGDINQETGNIRSRQAVHINGYVKDSFVVESQGSVFIRKNVENAKVKARGDISIDGGIRGDHCEIVAGGTLQAGFVERSRIITRGDISIKENCIGSNIKTQGGMTVGDRRKKNGVLIGGELAASSHLITATLGSPSYVKTRIAIGEASDLTQKLAALEEKLDQKFAELAKLDKIYHTVLTSGKAQPPEVIEKVINTRNTVIATVDQLCEACNRIDEHLQESSEGRVVILREVFPGVTIHIYNKVYKVRREMKSGTFRIDEGNIIFDTSITA